MSSTPPLDDESTRLVVPRSEGAAQPGPAPAPTPEDNGNALPAATRLSEFEVTGVIGEGGFGIVYLAWDHSLQRKVALKEFMPASLALRDQLTVRVRSARHKETFEAGMKSFINEARLLAQFDHPSLVKVYRFWEANGTAYMVMPLYEGITLKDCVTRMAGPPDEAWLLSLLSPLTEALAVIHRENCFHRDIAPDNVILLEGSGRPLLLDFGAARRVISDMTQALTVILKPGYAPVEQYAESPGMKQGAWTDVYALAATVHWAITGKTPPPSVGRLVNDSFEPLSRTAAGRYGEQFLNAIDRALKVRPEDRTQSIAAFRADLGLGAAEVHADGPATRPPNSSFGATSTFGTSSTFGAPSTLQGEAGSPAPKAARTGLWIGAGAALVIIGGVVGYMLLAGGPDTTTPPVATTSPAATATPAAPAAAQAEPPTAPAAATPPPPAPAFHVLEQMQAVLSSQTSGFVVNATPAKSQLIIGRDNLGFDVTSSRDGHVHVLVRGPDGSLTLLLPNEKAKDTRIKAGQRLRLPGPSWPLVASDPTGSEQFLVFVSASPRSHAQLGGEPEYIFTRLPTDERAGALASRWSSATPLLLGAAADGCTEAACNAYGAAMFTIEVLR
jgi:serine/threonine protein kinase